MRPLLQLLGLARKAGFCAFGHDAAKAAMRTGHAKLCLVLCNASPRLQAEFCTLALETKTPRFALPVDSAQLKQATQYNAVVLCVNHAGFAQKMMALLQAQTPEAPAAP